MTPTNLARLAAWAGITPETHMHLTMEFSDLYDEWVSMDQMRLPDPTYPGADPQLVDDVWAARVMWTLAKEGLAPRLTKWQDGGNHVDLFVNDGRDSTFYAPSATLALLLAARAAGVPEVVECMGDDSNG